MAEASLQVSVRIRDTERFRLFQWQLEQLWWEMRLMDDPFADRLEQLVDRLVDGGDDEKEPAEA